MENPARLQKPESHDRSCLVLPRLLPTLLWSFALPAMAAIDFSRDIQPILSENCYHCHGPDAAKRKGDLRLDEEKAAAPSSRARQMTASW